MRQISPDSRLVTLALLLLWAWVIMTVTHELGHVVAGIVGGAKLSQLELRPWHLPHSSFVGDDQPLITLWAGPLLGCLIPLVAAAIAGRRAVWLVAWFCVVANAAYLLLGYFVGDGELDSTKMIRAGTPPIVLLGLSAVALIPGYLQLRRACADVVSGKSPAMSRRGMRISLAVLTAWLIAQSGIGTLIHSAL